MSKLSKRIKRGSIQLCWSAADIFCMAIILSLKKRLATRSHEQALTFGKRVGTVHFILSSILHRLALQEESISRNIRLTFGDDMDRGDVQRTAKESYQHMAMSIAETLASLSWPERKLHTIFSTEGLGNLYDALLSDRGLIFTNGHYGNWEITCQLPYNLLLGKKIVTVMQDFPLRRFSRFLKHMRGSGLDAIHSRGNGTPQKVMDVLRGNGIVGILIDHHTANQPGIEVPFFKRPAKTQTAPAFLARETGAPVLPVFVRRLRTDPTKHLISIYPAIQSDPSRRYEEDAASILSYYRTLLEKHVREDPGQYLWTFIPWE